MVKNFIAWVRKPNKTFTEQVIELFVVIIPIAFLIRTFVFGLYQVPSGSMETTMLVGERFFADKFTPLFMPLKRGDIIAFNNPEYAYSNNSLMYLWQKYVDWRIDNWTKRIVGIPGDHLKGVIEEGKPVIYLNEKKLDEPYLNKYPLIFVYDMSNQTRTGYKSADLSKPYDQQFFYRMNADGVKLGQWMMQRVGRSDILYPQTPAMNDDGVTSIDVFDVHLGPDEYWAMGDNRLGSKDSRVWGKLHRGLIHGKIILRLWSLDSDYSWAIVDLLLHPIDFWSRMRWSRCLEWVK